LSGIRIRHREIKGNKTQGKDEKEDKRGDSGEVVIEYKAHSSRLYLLVRP